MGSKSSLVIAAGALALIAPAALFMAALVVRSLPQPDLASAGQQIVMWYSERMWTLWLLLLALPMIAFFGGLVSLAQGLRPRFPIAATTVAAAVILAIVVLHMAAN